MLRFSQRGEGEPYFLSKQVTNDQDLGVDDIPESAIGARSATRSN
jgi:hypothetical protein